MKSGTVAYHRQHIMSLRVSSETKKIWEEGRKKTLNFTSCPRKPAKQSTKLMIQLLMVA